MAWGFAGNLPRKGEKKQSMAAVMRRFMLERSALSRLLAISILAILQNGAPAIADEDDAKLCEQQAKAHAAVQACTRLLLTGNLDKAERMRVVMLRATAWFSLWDMGEAALDYSEILKMDPSNLVALIGRAEAYRHSGQYDKAAADFREILKVKPDDLTAHVGYGSNLLLAHKYEDSLAAFNRALEIDGRSVEGLTGAASAHGYLGNKEESQKNFQAALAIDPKHVPALIARAEAAELWGDRALAIDSYSAAIRLNGMQLKPRQALQRLGVETPP